MNEINNDNDNELLKRINSFKNDYYSNNSKNILFKKKQKIECAKEISQKFQLNELIEGFVYNIPNTSNIFLDYNIFKLFANESNYQLIIDYILKLVNECIRNYDKFSIHINLDSFTMSAAERYYSFIELYINNCLLYSQTNGFFYSDKLQILYIYNPPSVFDTIYSMFKKVINKEIKDKFLVIQKNLSKDAMDKLFEGEVESNTELRR